MNNTNSASPINEKSNISFSQKLENWLTNTFWFHYKWYFIIGVFIFSLLIMAAAGIISSVNYDWTVVYAHCGGENSEKVKEIQELLETHLPETGNNRRIDVKVIELSEDDSILEHYGEERMYGHLNNQDIMLFVLDFSVYSAFAKLGYFEDAVLSPSLGGLYCASNDAPVAHLSSEDEQYEDYSQEFLDEVYLEYVEEHEAYLTAVRQVIAQLAE